MDTYQIILKNDIEVRREELNGGDGETVRDVLSLTDNCSLEGNRLFNPDEWDERRRYEYFKENLAVSGGLDNPYYLLDVPSTIETTKKWIEILKADEADESIINEFQAQVTDLIEYGETHGSRWLNDGGSRCRTIIATVEDEFDGLSFKMPSPGNVQSMQYLNEEGEVRVQAIISPDGDNKKGRKMHFKELDEPFQKWFLSRPVKIIVLKNMLWGNAMLFFSRINKNYQMTDWILRWTTGMSKAKRLVKEHIDNNLFMHDHVKKNGFFDLIVTKTHSDFDSVFFGQYRLLMETVAMYKYHVDVPNSFDYKNNLVFGLLDAGEPISSIYDWEEIKKNLSAFYECIMSNPDFTNKTNVVDYRDTMSILKAISKKNHPVRRTTDVWKKYGDYEIKSHRARVAIIEKILKLIKMMEKENLYLYNENTKSIIVAPCSRDIARKSPYVMYRTYKTTDKYDKTTTVREQVSYKQQTVNGETHIMKPVDNDLSYASHRRDSNNIHLREEQLLERLQEFAEEFVTRGYLVPKRTTNTKEIADQKAMSNDYIVQGKKVKSLKHVEGGHIIPFSISQDDSLENIEPEMKKPNRIKTNKVISEPV